MLAALNRETKCVYDHSSSRENSVKHRFFFSSPKSDALRKLVELARVNAQPGSKLNADLEQRQSASHDQDSRHLNSGSMSKPGSVYSGRVSGTRIMRRGDVRITTRGGKKGTTCSRTRLLAKDRSQRKIFFSKKKY